jgi:hypothetical protein
MSKLLVHFNLDHFSLVLELKNIVDNKAILIEITL